MGTGRESAHGVMLAGADDAHGELWQSIVITDTVGPVQLSFWWLAASEGEQLDDVLEVILQIGEEPRLLHTMRVTEPLFEWRQVVLDLTQFAGQEATLTFLVHTDGETPSIFRLDDASVKVCLQPLHTVTPTQTPTITCTPTSAHVVTVNLCPTTDAYIKETDPGANYGSYPHLIVGSGESFGEMGAHRALLRYDLSFIPGGSQIHSASLRMRQFAADGSSPVSISVYSINHSWREMSVTWSNQPAIDHAPLSDQQSTLGVPTDMIWDVTQLVNDWVDGALDNHGVMLQGPEGGAFWVRAFNSRDSPYCPRLEINVEPSGPMQTPTLTPTRTGTCTATPTPTPTSTPTPTATPSLDLQVQYIEVTQAIQCKGNPQCVDNSVPMIAGKYTYARVYIKVSGTTTNVPNVTARLIAKPAGMGDHFATALNAPITAKLNPQRAQYNDTLNFVFASYDVATSCVFEAEVNPYHTVPESDYSNNKKSLNVTFKSTSALNIVPIWIRYKETGRPDKVVDWTMPYNLSSYLEKVLPVPDIQFHLVAGRYLDWDKQISTGAHWGAILAEVGKLRKNNTTAPSDAHWYAMVPFKVPLGGIAGMASMPGKVAAGRVPIHHENMEDAADIMAHELGHNWNRGHASCGATDYLDPSYPHANGRIGDYGWDTEYASGGKSQSYPGGYVVPSNLFDLMSYCQDEWVSAYTYKGILNRRGATTVTAWDRPQASKPSQGDGPRPLDGPTQPYLFASGLIVHGELDTGPWSIMARPEGFDDQTGEGPCRLVLVGGGDGTLFERRFSPTTFGHSQLPGEERLNPEDELLLFNEALPWNPETVRVEVWHHDTLLAERPVSAHAPTVELFSPQADDVWAGVGEQVVEWVAHDEDGDSLWFDVAFSQDGGGTWDLVATGLRETHLTVGEGQLPGTHMAMMRVYATDGVLTGEATSGPFVIEPKPPTVFVGAPRAWACVPPGVPLRLKGHAYDAEDGMLDQGSVWWTLDEETPLGEGDDILIEPPTIGWHTITFHAADGDAMVASSSVPVFVGHRISLPVIVER